MDESRDSESELEDIERGGDRDGDRSEERKVDRASETGVDINSEKVEDKYSTYVARGTPNNNSGSLCKESPRTHVKRSFASRSTSSTHAIDSRYRNNTPPPPPPPPPSTPPVTKCRQSPPTPPSCITSKTTSTTPGFRSPLSQCVKVRNIDDDVEESQPLFHNSPTELPTKLSEHVSSPLVSYMDKSRHTHVSTIGSPVKRQTAFDGELSNDLVSKNDELN